MKTRTLPLIIVMALMLMTLIAVPAQAESARVLFTGTFSFVSWEENQPESPGNASKEFAKTEWYLEATDARASGLYTFVGQSTRLETKDPAWGPTHGTWTMNNDSDPNPEWEGVVTVRPENTYFVWNITGHGCDEYAGLNMNIKIESGDDVPYPFPLTGHITK
jgi:hypothetical protein